MQQLIETSPINELFRQAMSEETDRVSAFMFAYTLDKHHELDQVLVEMSKHGLHLPGGKAKAQEFEPATKHHPIRWFYDSTLHRELKEESKYAMSVYIQLDEPVSEHIERYHLFDDGFRRNVVERVTFGTFAGPTNLLIPRGEGETDLEWMSAFSILSSGFVSGALQAAILRVGRLIDFDSSEDDNGYRYSPLYL